MAPRPSDGSTTLDGSRTVGPSKGGPLIAARRRVRVLHSFPEPRPTTNPYVVMLRRAIDELPDVEARTFTWRRALLGRYDVVHLHWPEILAQGSTPVRSLVRRALTAALVVRWRLTGTAVVRTLHNLERPSGLAPAERVLLGAITRATTLVVLINATTPAPRGRPSVLIPHGHYRDWFAGYHEPDAVPGRIGFVGLVRRYKGVEALVGAFRSSDAGSLRIAGRPSSSELAADVRRAAAGDDRIRLELGFVADDELVRVVGESSLVVLPYRLMHNSGGVLTALSLDRPVLVPANRANDLLAAEVGAEWVQRYDGELTADDLERALAAAGRLAPDARPDLSARGWDTAGRDHADAYRRAIAVRSRGRRYSA